VSNLRRMAIGTVGSLLALALSIDAPAQTPDASTTRGVVIGTGAVTSFVENMDRSLAFYHDAFGMEVPALPESGARVYNPTNAQLFAMFDIAGARERHQSASVRGTDVRLEIMEVQDVPLRTVPLRLQDPGTMSLVFEVRDLNATLERARQAHAQVVTPGGAPVALVNGGHAVLIRDVDGRFVELREAAAQQSAGQGESPLVGMRLSIAVADMPKTLAVYRDLFGFKVEEDKALGADKALRSLTGLAKAKFRRSVVQGPGGKLRIEFVEYGGVDRKPLDTKIQDRGAARLQLRAEHLEALVAAMSAAGMHVVSQGGVAVPIPPNLMGALVADPNGFYLTPFAPCDGCAPRLQRELH
jgi:catechol 2,3-dioxygenase-like lactoylglutathione lyase family enzyme